MSLPAGEQPLESTPFAQALAAAGLRLAEEAQAGDKLLAELAAARLGYPLWVRSAGRDDPRFCAALDSGDDLFLAFVQAAKRSVGAKVLLQRAEDGPCWRLWCNTRAPAHPVLVLEARFQQSPPYRLLESLVLPPQPPAEVVRMAEALRAAPPLAARWLEAEVVMAEEGAVLTALWQSEVLHPAVEALGATADGADGDWRAMVWLPSRSGRVVAVDWVDAARAAPGVLQVQVGVRPGDVLQHALDEASQYHIGYVIAAGYTREQAIARAREAARRIQLVASAMVM